MTCLEKIKQIAGMQQNARRWKDDTHLVPCKLLLSLVLLVCGLFVIVIALRVYQEHDEKLSTRNLETDVVKIDMQGYHFNVPLRYMHDEVIEERRNWSRSKREHKRICLNIDVLLHDMKPYYSEESQPRAVIDNGDRLHIAFVENKGDEKWFRYMTQMTGENASNRNFYKKEAEIYGLIHYSPMTKLSDEYYATDERRLSISCLQPQRDISSICYVRSNYVPGLGFYYYYSLRYLPYWREIDNKVKALFDQFQQAAQTEYTNKTQRQQS